VREVWKNVSTHGVFRTPIHKFRNAFFFVSIKPPCMTSGFSLEVDQRCALLGTNTACSSLPTDSLSFKLRTICCSETSLKNYRYTLFNTPEKRSSQVTIIRLFIYLSIHSVIHSFSSLSHDGPKPLPKRFLHIVRSRASSFICEYPLLSVSSSSSFPLLLPRLSVTSTLTFSFLH
jgi:hypothetical protein